MELEKRGDADHSIEMEAALKRFEDVCNSLEDEHTKLLALEKRRQQLNDDLERLRREIKSEKKYFRSVIDEQIMGESERNNQDYEKEQLLELAEPISLDTGAIKEFIENQREELVAYGKDAGSIQAEGDFKQCKVDCVEKGNLAKADIVQVSSERSSAQADLDAEKCSND